MIFNDCKDDDCEVANQKLEKICNNRGLLGSLSVSFDGAVVSSGFEKSLSSTRFSRNSA